MEQLKSDVIIMGAGPAGLAAATKLLPHQKSVTILEKEPLVGGISKTIEYKGFRFDLGGHRFFTKSKEVNELWERTLGKEFLTRPRLSRIYYRGRFFDYPVRPLNALLGLGFFTSLSVLASYLKSKITPLRSEKTFDQWVSNRFGKKLFNIFFKTYTEKLWGIPCNQIQAEWAAQRIKGLSLFATLKNSLFPDKSGKIKTLIDEFKYPKYGPGMMYEKMASDIENSGGIVKKNEGVIEIKRDGFSVKSLVVEDAGKNQKEYLASHFISSIPITTLIKSFVPAVPADILNAAQKLSYRSFITISVILDNPRSFPDTWIYVHSPEVRMGRIQNFKNWSPYMVPSEDKTALGLEYFCTEGDDLWNMPDKELLKIAMEELEKIGLGKQAEFVDGFVARVPKAYPVYDAQYPQNIKIVREYLQQFKNLQPIGRYGMFKYNNMDHSILTGLLAAENILGQKHNVWEINTDEEYHEEKR